MRWQSGASPTACAAGRRSCSRGRGRKRMRGPSGYAAFSRTVVPFANVAADIMFSVAPTLGKSK